MVWVSISPSAPETSYPLGSLVPSLVLVGRLVLPLDTPVASGSPSYQSFLEGKVVRCEFFWVSDAYRFEHPSVQSQDVVAPGLEDLTLEYLLLHL